MPATRCPACQAPVKFSKRAEPGSTVTCPECDEEFSPPELKVKKVVKAETAYDPEEEGTYHVQRRSGHDPEEAEKSRKVTSYARAAAARDRMDARRDRLPWHEGPEIWLLIFAVGAGGGLPFGVWLARNWEKVSDARIYWVAVLMIAVLIAAVGLGGSAWAAVRRGRNSL